MASAAGGGELPAPLPRVLAISKPARAEDPVDVSEWIISQAQREAAEFEQHARVAALTPDHENTRDGVSSVFTLRLDNRERAALEARAKAADVASVDRV